jgi:AcrR family transcriptional regulator
MDERHPTARRLIEHGLRLFVERGVEATPIVQIEEAAGLAPGSGAFYKHFRSKEQLLSASLEDATASAATGTELFDALESLDLRDQAMLIARGAWVVLDMHRDLVLVLAREPRYRPATFGLDPQRWPVSGPAFVTRWLSRLQTNSDLDIDDPEATALVLVDALTAYWRQRQTHTENPYGIDPDRFIDAWVKLILANEKP